MEYRKQTFFPLTILLGTLTLLLVILYFYDNKYTTPPPYGRDGVIVLKEENFTENRPIFLIDGWLLTDSHTKNLPTYIGEFSSLQRKNYSIPPHGKASYQLTLRYSGSPILLAASFPRLSTNFVIRLDDKILVQGKGSAGILFPLSAGDHVLTVETVSKQGYYSGMYFPPAIGTQAVLSNIRNTQTFVYAIASCVSLLLATFTLVLWRVNVRSIYFCLGILCCFFSFYLSHYFVSLFHMPLFTPLQEGLALYGLIFCVVRLTALAAGEAERRWFRYVQRALWIVPLFLMGLYFLIPLFPWVVRAHGTGKDIYFVFVFLCTVFLTVCAARRHSTESGYILASGVVFGTGLVCNLFFSNQFEPILFFWQFEWCGLILVTIFAAMMVARNKRIMKENDQLTGNLEQMVRSRTRDLQLVLNERKAFFSDMAHDLKAPLRSTQTFIRAIRENNTGVDKELLRYIDQVEQKQQEMTRRVQGLNVITRLDKIEEEPQLLSVCAIFDEIYATHGDEADVSSIHLRVVPPQEDCWIVAQQEKIEIVFENLIYNAMRATPPEGYITVAAEKIAETVHFTVSDTGCGISEKELPKIFLRFYVGERNKTVGSGLGLYIVQTIVLELGGTIRVTSTEGVGTTFTIQIPQAEQKG